MAGFSTASTEHLTRTNLWSNQLKDQFEDDLIGTRYVDWLTGFGDGDTFNIPSIGQMETTDYEEGQALRYTAMDTGNFTFTITEYKSAATYIYRKFMQDSFYASRLVSQFVPKMRRALMKAMEVDILALAPNAQTATDLNSVNGAAHRWVGAGTSETMAPEDFARALYAFQMASVPTENLVAIVHPSVEFKFNTLTNFVNVSNTPRWEGVVETGIASGLKFVKNIYGFDVYTSLNLKTNAGSEAIDGRTAAAGVANLFLSLADGGPFVGAVRQAPIVDSKFNMDLQREEYAVTTRYGLKLYRPEAVCVVLTDTDQVA